MFRSRFAIALWLAAALAAGCSSKHSDSASAPPGCTLAALGASCSGASQCCSGNCQNSICVKPAGQCGATNVDACIDASDCCQGACTGTPAVCVDPVACTGHQPGGSCTVPGDCCTNKCEGQVGTKVCVKTACSATGDACTTPGPSGDCCSGLCGAGNLCVEPTITCKETGSCATDAECCGGVGSCDAGSCKASLSLCDEPGEACSQSDPQRCCSQICRADGTCSSTVCKETLQACSGNNQCCSGICTSSICQPLPAGPTGATCGTLGEACATAYDCCSTYCQGATGGLKNGTCKPAAPCNAKGDICYVQKDCCSGICAPPAVAGQPGRCDDAPGGCGQDGYPCTSDSGCCNRKCLDLGTGAHVCAQTAGCRMNGDYCDSTAACCNVNNEVPQSQWVQCDALHVCDNGGACNPPGDICGYKASQDCCDGKKTVCKPDSNLILRCFGGCPLDSVDPCCKDGHHGYDANDPLCCIPVGTGTNSICQFEDQCCGGAKCTFNTTLNHWYCTGPTSCLAQGARCSSDAAPDPVVIGTVHAQPPADPCCTGASCRWLGTEVGWACTASVSPPPGCTKTIGQACSINSNCCVGTCQSGVCKVCKDNGVACAADADCCSAAGGGGCDPTAHVCVAACIPADGICSDTTDCCIGLTCNKANPGDTSGLCKDSGSGPTCSATGQSCVSDTDCCNHLTTGELCIEGVCGTSSCSENLQFCTAGGGQCCNGLTCYAQNGAGARISCGDPTEVGACFCDVPTCMPDAADCSSIVGCCSPDWCVNKSNVQQPCSSNDVTQHTCTCHPIG